MATIWQQKQDDTVYQVRQAGHSMRLYTNGVLHSQYNPERSVTSSVWDLLSLPSLFLPEQQIQRVLVLGVGGGAVFHQLQRWINPGLMVGIELNPVHLFVAKKFFSLDSDNIVLYEDDAVAWLRRYQGPPFDLIIDDLYGHENAEPVRAVQLDHDWCELLNQLVADDGLLVVNTVSWHELKESALMQDEVFRQSFVKGFRLVTPTCDNAVGAFFKSTVKKGFFNKRLSENEELASADKSGLLRYQMRTLF